jgi:protein TonB
MIRLSPGCTRRNNPDIRAFSKRGRLRARLAAVNRGSVTVLKYTSTLSPASQLGSEERMRRSLTGSILFHAAIIALLIGLPWRSHLPDTPPPAVTIVFDEPGSAGASGGSKGGGGEDRGGQMSQAAATSETAPEQTETASAEPSPPEPPAPAPEMPLTSAAPPSPVGMAAPEAPKALEPKAKPKPPRHQVAEAKPPRPHPPTPQAARPTPVENPPVPTPAPPSRSQTAGLQPLPGASIDGTAGQGAGAQAGSGQGTAGAGRGWIGDGDLQGPGDDYLERLRRWLAQYKVYPKDALKRKEEGKAYVSFTIHRDGRVTDPVLERSSGFPALDEAAMRMLRNASPVPPLPAAYRLDEARLTMPIGYSIGFFDKIFG